MEIKQETQIKSSVGDDLILKINELMAENKKLKDENNILRNQELYGWDNLSNKIEFELSRIDKRKYSNAKWKIKNAISQLIRETFDISFVKNLKGENYEGAKEIVDTVLNLVEKYFKN